MSADDIHNAALVVACDSVAYGYDHDSGTVHQVFKQMQSCVAMNIAHALHISGPVTTVCGACASGLIALDTALWSHINDQRRYTIVVATQETGAACTRTLDRLGVLSNTGTRPFRKDRDGFVPSGGAACLVLRHLTDSRDYQEVAHHALGRIYRIFRNNGHGQTLVSPDRLAERDLMIRCLRWCKIADRMPTILCAHATATVDGDEAEVQAIVGAEKDQRHRFPIVEKYKALTGHELWMSGLTQVLYTILKYGSHYALDGDGAMPPHDEPITAMANAFGFGGNNATCLFEVY